MTNLATIEKPGQYEAPAPITPMQMLQIAVEQGADLDKLSKLMDLQERWEANEARKAFVTAKAAFKAEAPRIDKNKQVGFTSQRTKTDTSYRHATLDHVEELVSPVLSKHGLTYSWETEQIDGGQIRVTCVLTHVMGHSERVTLQAGPDQSGNKNNIQAVGSTVSFLSRYTLLTALGLTTGDMDDDGKKAGDGKDGGTITDEQAAYLRELAEDTGTDLIKFCEYMKIGALPDLPASQYQRAVAAMEKKRGKA